jgi:hypothetical protein
LKTRILPLAREHGATVLLIGHSPKAPTQPGATFGDEHVARGASDWRNAADTLLYLKRDRTLGECAATLKHAKQRIGPRHPPLWFELQEPEPGRAVRLVYGGHFSEEALPERVRVVPQRPDRERDAAARPHSPAGARSSTD